MTHFEEHTYAFVRGNSVENICIFADHDDELANLLAKNSGADKAVDCCANGMAFMGGTWDGKQFIPPSPWPSWTWNDKTSLWESKVAYPTDGKAYVWDEQSLSWAAISNAE
jgi:hypothetical protein